MRPPSLAIFTIAVVAAVAHEAFSSPVQSGAATIRADTAPADVTVVSGRLVHYRLTNDLFHIDKLWMRVEPGTLFHRWLSDVGRRRVSVVLTGNPERFGDERDARILTGELVHGTTPQQGSSVVHVLFLRDILTDTYGPITFQTEDAATARKFDASDGTIISIVMLAR